jgi:hypothetical protein
VHFASVARVGAKFSVSQRATGSPHWDGPKQSGPFFSPTSSPTGETRPSLALEAPNFDAEQTSREKDELCARNSSLSHSQP